MRLTTKRTLAWGLTGVSLVAVAALLRGWGPFVEYRTERFEAVRIENAGRATAEVDADDLPVPLLDHALLPDGEPFLLVRITDAYDLAVRVPPGDPTQPVAVPGWLVYRPEALNEPAVRKVVYRDHQRDQTVTEWQPIDMPRIGFYQQRSAVLEDAAVPGRAWPLRGEVVWEPWDAFGRQGYRVRVDASCAEGHLIGVAGIRPLAQRHWLPTQLRLLIASQ